MLSCNLNRELIVLVSERTDVQGGEDNEGSSEEQVLSWDAEGEAWVPGPSPQFTVLSLWILQHPQASPASTKQSPNRNTFKFLIGFLPRYFKKGTQCNKVTIAGTFKLLQTNKKLNLKSWVLKMNTVQKSKSFANCMWTVLWNSKVARTLQALT